jgi:hypothetical protein
MISKPKNNTNGIQKGASTHHHDQLITPQSFSTMKTIPSSPGTLIPPEFLQIYSDNSLILRFFSLSIASISALVMLVTLEDFI